MRHDPASAAVVIMLRSLKMYGMAQAVTDLIEQAAPAFDATVQLPRRTIPDKGVGKCGEVPSPLRTLRIIG